MKASSIKKIKNECGSVQVVEMTLIFPLVIILLGFLIYAACYIMQGVMMYNDAQRIAMVASRQAAIPGYSSLYNSSNGLTSKADFDWGMGVSINKTTVDTVMSEKRPYRYFMLNNFIPADEVDSLESNLERLVESGSFLASSSVNCTITPINYFVCQLIEVNVVKEIDLPPIMEYIGLQSGLNIDVTVRATVTDPAEFVRNTDMVFDLATFLSEKINIGGESVAVKIKKFKAKVNSIKEKIGLEW